MHGWEFHLLMHRLEEGAGAESDVLGSYDFFPVTYILPGEYAIFVEVYKLGLICYCQSSWRA